MSGVNLNVVAATFSFANNKNTILKGIISSERKKKEMMTVFVLKISEKSVGHFDY
mgnify:FL=1